jgi:hypothetical protein
MKNRVITREPCPRLSIQSPARSNHQRVTTQTRRNARLCRRPPFPHLNSPLLADSAKSTSRRLVISTSPEGSRYQAGGVNERTHLTDQIAERQLKRSWTRTYPPVSIGRPSIIDLKSFTVPPPVHYCRLEPRAHRPPREVGPQ